MEIIVRVYGVGNEKEELALKGIGFSCEELGEQRVIFFEGLEELFSFVKQFQTVTISKDILGSEKMVICIYDRLYA